VLQQQARFDAFVTQYNHDRPHGWLAALDDFRNWLIRESA
jgi:hypothetical protein